MSVLNRVLFASSERIDLPDLLAIDGYVQSDFKYLIQSLIGDSKPYVFKGFDVIDPSNAINQTSISIKVANSVIYYPQSSVGAFFYGLEEGNALAANLVPELRKNATNYVYLQLSTQDATQDTRAFWDVDAATEFSQEVNTAQVLIASVGVSTSTFPTGTVPLCKVVLNATVITSIQDARDLMFRLGTGGLSADPYNTFSFRNLPSSTYARNEGPLTITSTSDPNPFQGGDKNIYSLKEWMDVVMTKILEMSGTTYWYQDSSVVNLINLFNDAINTTFKSKGTWAVDNTTEGLVTWSEDINVISTRDPRSFIIRAGNKTATNDQVLYLNLIRDESPNTSNLQLTFVNGANYINGALTSFSSLAKGDWIKKTTDTDEKYLRVEEFYTNTGLGGSTTTAVNAQSIRLSSTYAGNSETNFGKYSKGAYTSSDVTLASRNSATLQTIGGNFFWLGLRTDSIMNIKASGSPNGIDAFEVTSINILSAGALPGGQYRIRCYSAAHGLTDSQRLFITSGTHAGVQQIEVEDTDHFYFQSASSTIETGLTGRYAVVTTVARNTDYGFNEESANHGFENEQSIKISGTTNYNGTYTITKKDSDEFFIAANQNVDENPVSGFATLINFNLRSESGISKLSRGETKLIGASDTENIQSFIGMSSASQTKPVYSFGSLSTNFNPIDGAQSYGGSQDDDLTLRSSLLTAYIANKAQDKNLIFAESGFERINNTTNGADQDITFTSDSGSPVLTVIQPSSVGVGPGPITAPNTSVINLTTTLSLGQYEAAYFVINRNANTTLANLGALTVVNIWDVPLAENVFVFASRLNTNDVWLYNGLRLSAATSGPDLVSPTTNELTYITRQNRTLKLIDGGTWSWDSSTSTLASTSSAYIQIPGINNNRNEISAFSNTALTADGMVLYVSINRRGSTPATLTINASAIASLNPALDTVVIARRVGNNVLLGSDSILLTDGQALQLEGESDSVQLRMRPRPSDLKQLQIGPSEYTLPGSLTLTTSVNERRFTFTGSVIDFETGNVYEEDGSTALGINFTPPSITANFYRWFGITLVKSTLNADGTIDGQVSINWGTSAASSGAATKPLLAGEINLGWVLIQYNAGGTGINTLTRASIYQLGNGLVNIDNNRSFTLANNVGAATDITNFSFGSLLQGSIVSYHIRRYTTTDIVETGHIMASYNPDATAGNIWTFSQTFNNATGPDTTGITLSVTDLGQMQYTSTNVTPDGTGIIYFKINPLG